MLCDGQAGPTAADEEIIQWLRREHSGKQVILAVNKCESTTQGEYQAALFWEYGHEPLAISAISGTGTGVLMEKLIKVRPLRHAPCTRTRLAEWQSDPLASSCLSLYSGQHLALHHVGEGPVLLLAVAKSLCSLGGSGDCCSLVDCCASLWASASKASVKRQCL